MKDKGAKVGSVEVKYDRSARRHVLASRTISAGETVLSIPIECVLFDSMHTDDPILSEVQKKMEPRIALAFIIAAELKKENSKFAPFLTSIPSKTSSYLVYYTNAENEYAKGSTLMCNLNILIMYEFR